LLSSALLPQLPENNSPMKQESMHPFNNTQNNSKGYEEANSIKMQSIAQPTPPA
jgi:hypothetical protein